MKKIKILPPAGMWIAILSMLILYLFLPIYPLIPSFWRLLGLPPIIFGVAINLLADGLFHRANTTVKPNQESSCLITEGVFRWTRNPMYLGFLAILLGIAILLGALSPFAVVVGFWAWIQFLFIPLEEQMLLKKFGDQFKAYQLKTRTWL